MCNRWTEQFEKMILKDCYDGEVPFKKGFTLTKPDGTEDAGFFLAPSDTDSNNIKVFVVGSAIEKVAIVVV